MQNMTIHLESSAEGKSKKGLLGKGEFGDAVEKSLPVLDVADVEDPVLVAALYRDYCLTCSAYSLEPTHLGVRSGEEYKVPARDVSFHFQLVAITKP
jgi:hypothetical protein